MTLHDFDGTSVSDLKRAIKETSGLPGPLDTIKLFVKQPGEPDGEKRDVDKLEAQAGDEAFGLMTLCLEYIIKRSNPISIEFPGK